MAKNIITQDKINEIKNLFDQLLGTRKIADKVCLTRANVKKVLYELGLGDIVKNRKNIRKIFSDQDRECKKCHLTKNIEMFCFENYKTWKVYEYICLDCSKIINKKRRDGLREETGFCYDRDKYTQKELGKTEIEKLKKKKYQNEYDKIHPRWKRNKREKSIEQKIRCRVSISICNALSKINCKKESSISKYLPWKIIELKEHLELQFKINGNEWMNWKNYGLYKLEDWNDNDPSTWTWQLDHIYPQSELPYSSMSDETFKICWDLSNLRPLSSKENLLKSNKIIHEITPQIVKDYLANKNYNKE